MTEYNKPNYTQVPNTLLDEQMGEMGYAELKVVLAICRKTFGWHKRQDLLSFSQLEELTGMSRQGVNNGIQDAMDRGVIGRSKDGNSFLYWLVVNEVDRPPEIVNEVDLNGQASRPPDSQASRHTKERVKEKKEKDSRKRVKKSGEQKLVEGHAFSEYLRITGHGDMATTWPERQKLYYNPLNQICAWLDYDKGQITYWLTKTIQHMRKENLTIKTPQSIVGVCNDLIGKSRASKETTSSETFRAQHADIFERS